jgi:uncharacterized membrane protein YecN with MAPEG domain
LIIEDWIASLVSALLSFASVRSTVEGNGVFVFSLNHRFVVTLSCVDLVGIGLWAFIFGFIIWIYSNMAGISMSHRKYAFLGALGFVVFFFANILRMFVEIYYVSSAGPSFQSYFMQWQAFEEQVGMGIMLATFSVLLLSFHFTLTKLKPRLVQVQAR